MITTPSVTLSIGQTNGFECQTSPMQCFCTHNIAGQRIITVDLGGSVFVQTVIIRGSFSYDTELIEDLKVTVSCSTLYLLIYIVLSIY